MLTLPIDRDSPEPDTIDQAVDTLLDGGLVAYPTDTVCGLGCDATNAEAVARLCEAKGRDAGEPLPVIVHSQSVLRHLVEDLSPETEALLRRFWPGALTVVFRRRGAVLKAIAPPRTLGIRIPDCAATLMLARRLARPLVATSANLHGQAPLDSADEIAQVFAGRIDLVLDGADAPATAPSTVLDLSTPNGRVLREGVVSTALLARYLPTLCSGRSA